MDRLSALRRKIHDLRLDGFVVPLTDDHGSEYVPDNAQRLAWLTGFTGSAGAAVVLAEKAAVFIDGRYTIQAAAQVDQSMYDLVRVEDMPPAAWAAEQLGKGAALGFDAALHTPQWLERAKKPLAKAGVDLMPVASNPVDAVWADRPADPKAPLSVHTTEHAGETVADKRARIAEKVRQAGAEAAILTMTDSVAWAFNIRGGDVVHNPVALAYGIVAADGTARLFVDPDKLNDDVRTHLGNGVRIEDYAGLADAFADFKDKALLMDPSTASQKVFRAAKDAGARIVRGDDPVALMKAVKNPTEIQGMKTAHERDGVAMVRFLHWLAEQAPKGELDELTCVQKLYTFRSDTGVLKDTSFDTISGAGANGAIVHYRVTEETNAPLLLGSLYLVDSGGQYEDGTTDITRTIAVGKPTAQMAYHYTLVLKGYIALATARFPKGTTGSQLDAIARRPLWQAGLDYGHGTGHGVGCYLNVHEGPQRIAKTPNSVALEPGMIVSNEPGYYLEGQYGIRLENLELVTDTGGGDTPFYGFEPLTVAPYERELIDLSLLSGAERAWINAYHARVLKTLGHRLPDDTARWLAERCRAL